MAIYELLENFEMHEDENIVISENGTSKRFGYKDVKRGRIKPMFRKKVAWFCVIRGELNIEVW